MSWDVYTKGKIDEMLAGVGASTVGVDGGDGLSAALRIPDPAGWGVIIEDTGGASGDGFKYMSILKAAGRIAAPLDDYYVYLAGHNTAQITLATGPTPVGPWTMRGTVSTPSAYLSSHKSSPWAIWWGGEVLLYVHGALADGSQGTSVFRSADGRNFTEHTALAFPTTATTNRISFRAHAATYLRVTDAGGYLVAVFQANGPYAASGADVPVATGWATSSDGLTWHIAREPLIANRPGERGIFDPSLFRAGAYWVLTGYNPLRGKMEVWASDQLKPGTFRYVRDWFGLEAVPGYDWMIGAHTFWDDGTCHIYVGSVDSAYTTKGKIHHATLDWSSLQ